MSRLRKTLIPFSWNTITASFTQGVAGSVDLSSFLFNPRGFAATYGVVGTLPEGVTLSGSLLSYSGVGAASSASVAFTATSGAMVAQSLATTVSVAVATGDWQLASGHYVPAKMAPVIIHPRPDGETNTWERHRLAPAGIPWRIPITVQGGSWPFRYTVDATSAAKGITIGRVYGDVDYGVLSWANPTLGTHTITVTVETQETGRNTSGFSDPTPVTFNLTVADKNDTSRFIWLDIANGRNYTAGATGSFSDPFKHLNDWYRTNEGASFVGRQVFYRAGTYPFTNGAETSPGVFDMTLNSGNIRVQASTAPMVHIGYPGETVEWNCSDPVDATAGLNYGGKWVGSNDCTGLHVHNIQMQNARQDVSNAHFFWLTDRPGEKRVTLFENRFVNIKPGLVGTDNTSVMFGSRITQYANRGQYYALVGNYLTGLGGSTNGVSFYDLYMTEYIVAENNTAENLISRYLFWHKALNGNSTVRNNVAWNGIACFTNPSSIAEVNASMAETVGAPVGLVTPIEVCWNRFWNQNSNNTRAYTISCDVTATNLPTSEYHVYRNTVGGMIGEEGTITPNSSVQNNLVLRNAGQTTAIKAFTEITPLNNVTLANGDLDTGGRLTGAARTNYLGTHGAEVN